MALEQLAVANSAVHIEFCAAIASWQPHDLDMVVRECHNGKLETPRDVYIAEMAEAHKWPIIAIQPENPHNYELMTRRMHARQGKCMQRLPIYSRPSLFPPFPLPKLQKC